MPDTFVISSAEALLACLEQQMLLNPNPPQNFGLRVGSDPVAADFNEAVDFCCQGIVYVRVVRRFPSGQQFPIADEQAMDCAPAGWAVHFEMGSFRCAPDGMDPEAWEDTFVNVQNDQQAMISAICCWVEHQQLNNPGFLNFMVNDWFPFALQGGCTGGAMQVIGQFQSGGAG